MRRRRLGVMFLGLLVVGALAAAIGEGFSDGVAGSSGAVPIHLRECQGGGYCRVRMAHCGGCHGQYDEMWNQEDGSSEPPPQTRVSRAVTFSLDGDARAGTSSGLWEYVPGQSYTLEIAIDEDVRPPGTYNAAGFNLNASAGWLDLASPNDDTLRLTGGPWQHAGTKNSEYWSGSARYGATLVDESAWAGEATQTAKGAEQRQWTLLWTAPGPEEPRGMAFVMTVLIPNGDGIDSCTRQECNSTQPYKPQAEWDWFGLAPIPRRLLCEDGAYDTFAECQRAVICFILPPAPPLATEGPEQSSTCPTLTSAGTDGTAGGSPTVSGFLLGAAIVALAWGLRRRRAC